MQRLALVIACMGWIGCGGTDPGQVKSWSGSITLVANGSWNETTNPDANTTKNDVGNEMESLKCLLMGLSGGAKLTEDYTVDDTVTLSGNGSSASTHVVGTVQGSQQYAGGSPDADDHCHAFLNTRSGDWSIEIFGTAAITGSFMITGPTGATATMTDSSSGEDFWPLSMVGSFAASGSDGPKSPGALDGMKVFTPPRGSGTITLTWSVSPEM